MTLSLDLSGKAALVTGSTSGIGLGIARELAAHGADVMLNGFGEAEEIEATRAEVEALGPGRAAFHGADLSQPDEIEDLIRTCEDSFGKLDILVNNAGIQHTARIEAFPPTKWDAVLAINLSGAFHTMRHAIPSMRARGWGRIINIASAHGLVASVEKAAYVAAKHGIMGLTKVAALENAGSGITVNAICPGWVLTPLVARQIESRASDEGKTISQAQAELLEEKQPSGDFVTPEQLGGLTVFLCSPAADQITGVPLSADGGWTAR